MKFLIIQTAFIGDVVLATPLLEKIHHTFPEASIDILIRKGNQALFDSHPFLHEILILDKKNKYSSLLNVIRTIRSTKYDYVVNIQRFLTTGIITALSKGKEKIGFDKNPLSFFFTKKIKHQLSSNSGIHEVERNLKLIAEIAGEGFEKPRLYPSEKHRNLVPTHTKYVCLAPASNWFTKQFPFEKWCELVMKIPGEYSIFLLGGPDDVPLCKKIKAETQDSRIEIFAGKSSFLESAALLENAAMTFSNDSGPLHFASAVNAPVTAIFCSTLPQFGFGPLSDTSIVLETEENLACRPCGLHGKKECPLGHFKCSNISIDRIIEKSGL